MAADPHLIEVRTALAARYRIEKEIGRGSAARVYVAEDLETGRRVAVKVLRDELAAAVARDRFQREIAIASSLDHPNILPILASAELGGFLFYVMPYVEGESLRQRLVHERQLPVEEAISIARHVAAGLAAAHGQGIVHRDIKPENILLSGGHAVLADFGIARAITSAAGDRLTSTGLAIGTPGYMSPEQAAGDRELDQHSDVYSLACVLYEMLAGEPPYAGPSPQSIFAKQIAMPVPSVRTVRESVGRATDHAIQRALAKVPADRFGAVEDFAAALVRPDLDGEAAGHQRGAHRRAAIRNAVAVVGVVAVTVLLMHLVTPPRASGPRAGPDTTRYVVLPVEAALAMPAWLSGQQALHDALVRWNGITVVDAQQVQAAVQRHGLGPLSPSAMSTLARGFGAGRILRATASSTGDSIRFHVGLYDAANGGALLAEQTVRLAPGADPQASALDSAVDFVLFLGAPPSDAPSANTTRSFPARREFGQGMRALAQWNLPRADSAFTGALVFDPQYAQAQLWLALVRSWSGAPTPEWRVMVEQAVRRGSHLSAGNRLVAEALLAETRGDWNRACPLWREASDGSPNDFATWYGLARCLATDNTVQRDANSPSGWSFRTSYQAALAAYDRAFELQPSILDSFRPHSFEWLRFLFKTGGNELRGGHSLPPDTIVFAADPQWVADTLGFVPYPQGTPRPRPATSAEAVRRLRQMFREVTMTWLASRPNSAAGLEALSISLAMLGDPAALDTLRHARLLARDPADRFRIADDEVWMQLGFAIPQDEHGIRQARQLADSLLANAPSSGAADPRSLAGLAALTGRADAAAAYAVASRRREAPDEPLQLRETAPALLVYAAMAGPLDSLKALEPRVWDAIGVLPPAAREAARSSWLIRSASMAFPVYRFATLARLAPRDPLLQLEESLDRGDTAAVRRGLEAQHRRQRNVPPEDLTMDGLLPEADLLLRVGEPDSAAAWLDPTLGVLAAKPPDALAAPEQAACLVRVMALRALIALRMHDRVRARRWARAVVLLWSDADAFLQPIVAQQKAMM